jgi:hypothetical protein
MNAPLLITFLMVRPEYSNGNKEIRKGFPCPRKSHFNLVQDSLILTSYDSNSDEVIHSIAI